MRAFLKYGFYMAFIVFLGAIASNMYIYRYKFSDALVRTILYPFASMTIWTPEFSEKDFSKIKLGTSKSEVVEAIGKPLIHSCEKTLEAEESCDWIYTQQGTNLDAYDRRAVSFDEKGKVDHIWHGFDTN